MRYLFVSFVVGDRFGNSILTSPAGITSRSDLNVVTQFIADQAGVEVGHVTVLYWRQTDAPA